VLSITMPHTLGRTGVEIAAPFLRIGSLIHRLSLMGRSAKLSSLSVS